MKATITSNGTLKITAESEIESYALDHWFKGFDREGGPSVLQVCGYEPPLTPAPET
jgi:hypothetical protein